MTRTKNRVYFIAPEENPSEFLLEIKHDYKNVSLKGQWNEDPEKTPFFKKSCPICGYPMQFRYKAAYGLRLYICTNEPEVCGFMTNEYKAGKLSIIKCDQCRDGYLIVKPGRDKTSYMLGCTNYKKDGTGCSRLMSPKYYYEYMGLKDTTPAAPVIVPKGRDIKPKNSAIARDQEPARKPVRTVIEKANISGILYRGLDLDVVLQIALQCLSDISINRFYNSSVLIDILRGNEPLQVKDISLMQVGGFGKLKTIGREDLEFIVDWLIEKKFVLETKERYPVLHPTYNGIHYGKTVKKSQLIDLKKRLEETEQDQ